MAEVYFSEILNLGRLGSIPLDMVPEDEIGKYRFWRAASLAKIALNIEADRPALNVGPPGDSTIFFFDNRLSTLGAHTDASFWADSITHTQLTTKDVYDLQQKVRRPLNRRELTRIILALDTSFNDLELPPEAVDPEHPGVDPHRTFGLDAIDPYSREVIEGVLGLAQ